jgi:PAS domain S-box-containing protein
VHPDDRARFANHLRTLSGSGAPEEVEGQFRIKIANGNWRWLQARETVFTRDAGRPSLILGTAHDVTEQKVLEARVAELEEQARQLQASPANAGRQAHYSELDDFAPDMMALVDMVSGKVVQCNEAFAEAAGQRKEDLLGRTREEISHSGVSETVRAALAAVETETETDLMLSRPDGSQVRLLHRATPVRDDAGRVVAKRAVWRDVTGIRRVEQAMARQAQELATAQAELADFAYIASHDLKEPLRGISNYAGFLLEDHTDTLDDKAKARLETIVRLAKRQEEIVDTLLYYSQLGTAEVARRRVDLQSILQRAIDSLQPLASQANAEIRVTAPLPTIECDGSLVLELFTHLISNAIRFNDKAQKRVEIGFEAAQDKVLGTGLPGAPFVFHVRDNGIGISEKHRATIFQFLKRLHGRDEYGGGVGAGLAIAGKIVEKHRGKIWLQSHPGEGTTFYFTLQQEGR